MKLHRAEVPGNVQLAGSNAQNFAVTIRNHLHSFGRLLAKDRRPIPDIKVEKAARMEMPASRFQRRQHIVVFMLITENSKHHQGGIKPALKLDRANIPPLKAQTPVV